MAGTRDDFGEGGGAADRKVRAGDEVDSKHHPRHYH